MLWIWKRICDLVVLVRLTLFQSEASTTTSASASPSLSLSNVVHDIHHIQKIDTPPQPLNRASELFLDYVVVNPVIYDTIFDASSAEALIRLMRTCHTIRCSVKSYFMHAFNINRHLARYFTDPMAFRYLQACTGTLISGSTALQFFDRSFYPESDLDLYTPTSWRLNVGHFLVGDGYHFTPNPHQNTNFEIAISEP
ncbi:hypothetical protein QCA50_018889 [Cerrena zonata]|uniref:Uncharacterized protein n=1 Tax=Cerrena zonata TaxID=2478898 RepID=A0AAW0FCH6_9APHY